MEMQVSLDGGVTWQDAPNGVRVIYKNVMIDENDRQGEVLINATHEGLITDIFACTEDETGDESIATDCLPIEDIVARLCP